MKWRCALIQRRLPDYPDGDLSPFWKRHVASHLEVCPDCRQEAAELAEVMGLYQDQPVPDPGPAFWQDFQRDLHLKLAQVNQPPEPSPWRLRLPHYLLGATATVGVLVLAIYLIPVSRTTSTFQMAKPQGECKVQEMAQGQELKRAKLATAPAPAPPAPTAAKPAAMARLPQPEPAPAEEPQINLAAGQAEGKKKVAAGQEGALSEDDDLDWDVDSVVADLSRDEQQCLKSKLESRR